MVHEVYRGYIAFAFSITMSVFLSFSKISQELINLRF